MFAWLQWEVWPQNQQHTAATSFISSMNHSWRHRSLWLVGVNHPNMTLMQAGDLLKIIQNHVWPQGLFLPFPSQSSLTQDHPSALSVFQPSLRHQPCPRTGHKPCRLVLLDGRTRLQPSQAFKGLWPPLEDFELQAGPGGKVVPQMWQWGLNNRRKRGPSNGVI